MGQYWMPVNLDKKEFIHPYKLGSGSKLWEQLAAHPATGAALIILCSAMREVRGGGDFNLDKDQYGTNYIVIAQRTIGRWAGDRIALIGDYAEDSDLSIEFHASKIKKQCDNGEYENISEDVCTVIEHELNGKYTGDKWRDFKFNVLSFIGDTCTNCKEELVIEPIFITGYDYIHCCGFQCLSEYCQKLANQK